MFKKRKQKTTRCEIIQASYPHGILELNTNIQSKLSMFHYCSSNADGFSAFQKIYLDHFTHGVSNGLKVNL